jgi:hypothetical protein
MPNIRIKVNLYLQSYLRYSDSSRNTTTRAV